MFRIVLWIIATVALSWVLAFGRMVLRIEGREPTVWSGVGLAASLGLLALTVVILGFYEYKAEKAKGNVRRTIRLYEQALEVAAARRAERGEPDEPQGPQGA